MDFKIAWWNCRLSPPATQANQFLASPEFFSVVEAILDLDTDFLGLCEVNEEDCEKLAEFILLKAKEDPRYKNYVVRSFYSKSGNKIDDYGIVYRADKLEIKSDPVNLNTKADVTDKHLKVGTKVSFTFNGDTEIWVILCHWQSMNNLTEHTRTEVAQFLRASVQDICAENESAHVVICGDFNDEPFSTPLQMGLKASRDMSFVKSRSQALFNPFWRLIGVPDLIKGRHLPAGTCKTKDSQEMTHWRTFDQIILSSAFLQDDWVFIGSGVEIMNEINVSKNLTWSSISDHYPVMCNLKRII